MEKAYYAIIPANVRYDEKLKDKAKLLYGEITALTNEKGFCWASNSYFADLYKVTKETISRLIKNLADGGYVKIEMVYKNREIIGRKIYVQTSNTYMTKNDQHLFNSNNQKVSSRKHQLTLLTKKSNIIIQYIIIQLIIH
ncbi:MAG: helix-turn-helix domain-containing protein [Clostridium neonatale]